MIPKTPSGYGWEHKRVLITVRTYPTPARKGVEVSCTAGITDDGQWIRLFPIPYRSLAADQRFKKYQWINVEVSKARGDFRRESHTPNLDTIEGGEILSTANEWRPRWEVVRPLIKPSLCAIQRERKENNAPTLGIFKPQKIDRLIIENDTAEWDSTQLTKLNQTLSLFKQEPVGQLEKIPYNFKYKFTCFDAECTGHTISCIDWEIGQSYRKWRKIYKDTWEDTFRNKYEVEMKEKFDTHFFVGNMHQHPSSFLIVGLYYPPFRLTSDLFDAN